MAKILIQTYCPFDQINGSPKYVLKPWKHHKNAVSRPQLRPMPWVYVFLISCQVNSIEATRYKSQESQLSKRPYLPPRFRSLFPMATFTCFYTHTSPLPPPFPFTYSLHPTPLLFLLHCPSHTVYTPHSSSSPPPFTKNPICVKTLGTVVVNQKHLSHRNIQINCRWPGENALLHYCSPLWVQTFDSYNFIETFP